MPNHEYAVVEDGISVSTKIPRSPGLHPEVKLTFRPALYAERQRWVAVGQRDFDGSARAKVAAEIISKHVEQWDIKRKNQQAVDCRSETEVVKLHPALTDRMLDLILGYSPAPEDAGPLSGSASGS